ncbi:GAF and ANTAR domain-containing protein [Lentzea sp. NPDC054927]
MSGERLAKLLSYLAEDAAARGITTSSEAVCDACIGLIGVSGAQLTLMTGTGRGESRYSTDEIGTQLENLRFTLGEGPSEDAVRSGVPVLVGQLDSWENDQRWPLFVPAAITAGARAMFVFPLRSGAIRIGALVLHRTSPGPLSPEQVQDAHVVADLIMSLLLDELTRQHLDSAFPPADGMPLSRAEVHQATGMLSVQLGVSMEEALVRLRAHAFAHDQSVVDVARDVVARRLRLSPEGPV